MNAHQAGSLEREGKRRRLSCNKDLVLLVSSKRTEQQEAASRLRLVTKDIIDGLAEADAAAAEKFTAIAYCAVHNLKDFVLDPPRTGKKLQYALAIACSKSATEGQAELIVEQLQLLREADVDVATKCMRQLLLMSSVTATRGPPPGTHAPWTESTAPALQSRGRMHLQHRAYTPAATERILEPLRLRRRVLEVSLRIADGRNASAQELARSKEQLVLSTQTHFSCRALLADKNSRVLAPPVRRICCSTHYSRTTPCVPSSYSLSYCFSIPRVCTQRVMFLAVALYNSIAPKGSEILRGGGLLTRYFA